MRSLSYKKKKKKVRSFREGIETNPGTSKEGDSRRSFGDGLHLCVSVVCMKRIILCFGDQKDFCLYPLCISHRDSLLSLIDQRRNLRRRKRVRDKCLYLAHCAVGWITPNRPNRKGKEPYQMLTQIYFRQRGIFLIVAP